jgi:glycerol-3-phosphate dehydrogenase
LSLWLLVSLMAWSGEITLKLQLSELVRAHISQLMTSGVLEMQKFGLMFFPDCKKSTFTEESCGIADVITSCAGGRNRLCAEQFVKTGKVDPSDIVELITSLWTS